MLLSNENKRVVKAAITGLFISSVASQATAQTFSTDYSVSGSNVTGSGTSNSAFFTGAAGAGYNVTIDTGAHLTGGSPDQLNFDHGTVTIQSGATIGASGGDAVSLSSAGNTSTITNSGTVSGNDTIAVNAGFGNTSGWAYAENTASGIINGSQSGINMANIANVTIINAGQINTSGTNFSGGIRLFYVTGGSGSIVNSGSVYSTTSNNGASIVGAILGSSSNNFIITNTGTLTAISADSVAGGVFTGGYNTINNSGNISATSNGDVANFLPGGAYGVDSDGHLTLNNSGNIAAIGAAQATGVQAYDSSVITNSGSITASSGTAAYGVIIGNNAIITNSGTITGTTFGIQVTGNNSSIMTTTGGVISGGTDAIALAGTNAMVTVIGQSHIAGTIEGDVTTHGTPLSGNVLNFYMLATPAQIDAFQSVINSAGTGMGSYTIGSDTYSWDSFSNINLVEDVAWGMTINNTGASHALYSFAGSNNVTINNTGGTITGKNYGVYLGGNNSSISTAGGTISGGVGAIGLAGTHDTVTVRGQSHIVGTIEGDVITPGTPLNGNVLNLNLTHLSHSQIDALKAEVTSAGSGMGSFTFGADTYSWDSFATVNLSAVAALLPQVDGGLGAIAGRLDNFTGVLPPSFDPFYAAAANNPEAALNSLTGRQFINTFHSLSRTNDVAFGELTDGRASDIRSGGDHASNGPVMVASLYDKNRMNDAQSGSPELNPHWNAWISGSVTRSNQSATFSDSGYHAVSATPTVGADVRVTPELSIGGLLSMQEVNADFADGSSLNEQTGLLGAYASWSQNAWFVNGLLGGGYSSYDNQRMALNGQMATSMPAGNKLLANLSGGHDFDLHGWTLSPIAGVQYTRIGINAYTETGAGAYDLSVADQTINSLRSKLGARLSHDISWNGLAFTPNVRANWYHELLNGTQTIDESISGAPELGNFGVQSVKSDQDFAMFGVGLSAHPIESNHDVTVSLDYSAQESHNFFANTIYGNVRLSF